MSLGAVILAGGRNTRVSGAPEGFKPLMRHEGRTLLEHALIGAIYGAKATDVVVVASPANAAACVLTCWPWAVRSDVHVVLQPTPRGPGDALMRGLSVLRHDRAVVLLGDNLSSNEDIERVIEAQPYGIGIAQWDVNDPQITRMTRRRPDGSWVEKTPLTVADHGKTIDVWVGPFTVPTERAILTLTDESLSTRAGDEIPIGPLFGDLVPDAVPVLVKTQDVEMM